MAATTSVLEINGMKIVDLKGYLQKRGLPVSGNKTELVARVNGAHLMQIKESETLSEVPRVDKLLTPLNETLPSPADLKTGWMDISEIPSFTDNHLYNYLVLDKQRTCDFEGIGARRALRARVFYEDGHVHSLAYHPVEGNVSHGFVKGKCIPSYPSKNVKDRPDYAVWICLSKVTGRVHSADCTCTAGAGESCNHIAATLYAMVDVSSKRETGELASTSKACKWNKPRKRKLSPKRSSDMKFQKFEWKRAKRVDSLQPQSETSKKHVCLDISKFKKSVEHTVPHAAWLKNFASNIDYEAQNKENVCLPVLHRDIQCTYADYVDLSNADCVNTFYTYFDKLTTTEEQAKLIEKATRGQSTCDLWRQNRIGRLTASKFGIIIKRKETTPPDNLLKVLLDYVPRCETSAMKWGLQNESVARDSYVTFQRSQHPPLTVQESGLVVLPTFPHLGASPDGLVYCPHCPNYEGVLEIKCPFTARNLTPHEAAKSKDFYCTVTKNGCVKLKRNHSYFFQIQGQLALTKRKWCDFVVWTTCGMSIERIYFDEKLWKEDMLPKLNKFYKHSVIPELFSLRVKRGIKLYV